MSKKRNVVFDGKELISTASLLKLPVFSPHFKTEKHTVYDGNEQLTIFTNLNQKHRDIIDAIIISKTNEITNQQLEPEFGDSFFTYLTYICYTQDVLNVLYPNAKNKKNYKWLKEKLDEIMDSKIKIIREKHIITLNIFSSICKVRNFKPVKSNKDYFAVTFTKEYVTMIAKEWKIYAKPELIKKIITIKSDYVKALIRYCIANTNVNITFKQFLNAIDATNKPPYYITNIKKQILKHKDILKKDFNITIDTTNKNNFTISYSRHHDVALDFVNYLKNKKS